ncbi:MAG: alginate lyase family protein [Flavobacteriaceae bacterium]|nr:alginate lyase family protein [Flavobacteriaceae bacterium]
MYSYSYKKNQKFEFLNRAYSFSSEIDWNFNAYGKLWTYNLNYFDFLNEESILMEEGLNLINHYIQKDKELKDGKEAYPISLRGINWIKFLSKHSVSDEEINKALYNHYQILLHNLEYHLLGNHLLENAYSLFFGAYYFKDETMYSKATRILRDELEEQILKDGAHFELSPMYHQILFNRILDCIMLSELNPWKEDDLVHFLKDKAAKMLSWLREITFANGNIPMVNDCAYDIAPSSEQLFDYARSLKIPWNKVPLKESGYRKYCGKNYELFLDAGNIGPDYQPGHAHSDTFSFELYLYEKPFIVDVGTSTYEKNERRQNERQTFSHNTVMVNGMDQSQVWGGFRVAKRAKIISLKESVDSISARHDGYASLGVIHERNFSFKKSIKINDKILVKGDSKLESQAYFHIHPSIDNIVLDNNQIFYDKMNIALSFEGIINNIWLEEYEYCLGYNKTELGQRICIEFSNELKTTILL